jgi:hypothetical protein
MSLRARGYVFGAAFLRTAHVYVSCHALGNRDQILPTQKRRESRGGVPDGLVMCFLCQFPKLVDTKQDILRRADVEEILQLRVILCRVAQVRQAAD